MRDGLSAPAWWRWTAAREGNCRPDTWSGEWTGVGGEEKGPSWQEGLARLAVSRERAPEWPPFKASGSVLLGGAFGHLVFSFLPQKKIQPHPQFIDNVAGIGGTCVGGG